VNRLTRGIDGTETFDVVGERRRRSDLVLVIHRLNGESIDVPMTCGLDTTEELSIYGAGGALQRFAQDSWLHYRPKETTVTPPRLLFIAKPPPEVLDAMQATVMERGLDARLGREMFSAKNWHQSLSDRNFDASERSRQQMLRAGARVRAHVCTLALNRIRGQGSDISTHWAYHARGKPANFTALVDAVRAALREEGVGSENGHTPHVTISYEAPDQLKTIHITPIPWTINEILLVKGGGNPYRYHELGRWPLLPDRQASLF